jgi:hypothetical protein
MPYICTQITTTLFIKSNIMKTQLTTSVEFLNNRLNSDNEYRFGQLEYDFSNKCIADAFRDDKGIWNVTVFFTKIKGQKIGFLKTKKQVIEFINKYSINQI